MRFVVPIWYLTEYLKLMTVFAMTKGMLDFAQARLLPAKLLPARRLRAGRPSGWEAPQHLVLQEQMLESAKELMLQLESAKELMLQRFRVLCWLRRLLGHFERALIPLAMKQEALNLLQVPKLLLLYLLTGRLLDWRRQLAEGVPVLLGRALL